MKMPLNGFHDFLHKHLGLDNNILNFLVEIHMIFNTLICVSKVTCIHLTCWQWLRRPPPCWILHWSPTLLRKKLRVRLVSWFTFPIFGMYILNNILHLLTMALNQLRTATKVRDIFVQCLHSVGRFLVSLPWRISDATRASEAPKPTKL